MVNKKIKLYSIEFLEYSDVLKKSVSDMDGNSLHLGDIHYIDADRLIVKESDLPYYQRFGGGFKSIHFVGYLGVPEDEPSETTCDTAEETKENPAVPIDYDVILHRLDPNVVEPTKTAPSGQFILTPHGTGDPYEDIYYTTAYTVPDPNISVYNRTTAEEDK